MLREVTYESVLKRLRKTYHGFVADWLIVNSGDRIGEYSGLIAEHLLLAERIEQALPVFQPELVKLALASLCQLLKQKVIIARRLDLSISDFISS